TADASVLGASSYAPIDPDDAEAGTVDPGDPASGVAHVAASTDDGDACTADSCDPAAGIAHVAVSTDDGDVCTADACDAALGVTHTPVPNCCATTADCASGICTANTCQPASCGDGAQIGRAP